MLEILIIITTLVITVNNTSLIRDYISLSGLIPRQYTKYVISIPIVTGLLAEGYKLTVYAERIGIPETERIFLVTFISSVFILGTILKIPTSATLVTVGGSIGVSLYLDTTLDLRYIILIFILWIVFPIMSIAISKGFYNLLEGVSIRWIRRLSFIPTFLVGYVFGANTLGLIIYLDPEISIAEMAAYIMTTILATLAPSQKIGESISKFMYGYTWRTYLAILTATSILIEIAQNISIPMPLTTLLTISTLGPVLGRRLILINLHNLKRSIIFWIITLGASILLSYISMFIFNLLFFS